MSKLELVVANFAASMALVSAFCSDVLPDARFHHYWPAELFMAGVFATMALCNLRRDY